jgi:predicted cupin superfamily sugar epimerase
MKPHPEGGYYKEIYRSEDKINSIGLPSKYCGDRNFSTSIYFLLESNDYSSFHKIESDEIWVFLAGGPLILKYIDFQGNVITYKLGNNPENDEEFQVVIPANHWFCAYPENHSNYTLSGCFVAPGFDFADFELAKKSDLLEKYPQHLELIQKYTRY